MLLRPRVSCRYGIQMRLNPGANCIQIRQKTERAGSIKASKLTHKAKKDAKEALRPPKPEAPKKKARDPLLGMREAAQHEKTPKYRPIPENVVEEKVESKEEPQVVEPAQTEEPLIEQTEDRPASEIRAKDTETPTEEEKPLPIQNKAEKMTGIPKRSTYMDTVAPGGGPPIPSSRWPSLFTGRPIISLALLAAGIYLITMNRRKDKEEEEEKEVKETKEVKGPTIFIPRRNITKCLDVLQDIFGERFSSDESELAEFGGEGIMQVGKGTKPIAVVWPETTEEVEVILNVTDKYKIPIVAHSGGTSLEGYTLF
jgi:hypothetical protein